MKQTILCIAMALLTGSLMAAPKDDVQAAIKKLSDADNYTWKTTTEGAGGRGGGGGGGRFGGGPTEGKANKEGFALVTRTIGENTSEAVIKGDKGVAKTDSGWQTQQEIQEGFQAGGGGGFGAFGALGLLSVRAPAVQAADLLSKVKEVKMEGDTYVGELPAETVNQLSAFGRGGFGRGGRGGQAPAALQNGKGSIKFWVKEGALTKYQYNVQGSREGRDGNMVEINTTTTVEISGVGSTKVEVPADAKKKLG
jgi:hypothetical protein